MQTILVVIATALLVHVIVWHHRFVRGIVRLRVPACAPARYPSLSVIRPVRGLDVGAEENFRAALATSYPGDLETLFVFDDASDPALPVARRVVAEHRASGAHGDVDIVFAGGRPAHRTGKLHAMIVGMARARGTLVAFGDSDSRPSPRLLVSLVDALYAAPDIGATFAPVVVVDPPQTLGDVGYALMLNALYGPVVARAAGARARFPFIMGQLMVLRREALAAAGGLECADHQLVDDMHIGRCVSEAGYANVMIVEPLAITNRGTPLRRFLQIYRRWMLFGQDGIPVRYTWPLWLLGAGAWLACAVFGMALATGSGWAVVPAAAVLVAKTESLVRLHVRFGGARVPLRLRPFAIALFLLAPFIVASMRARTVEWRGQIYALGRAHGLAAAGR